MTQAKEEEGINEETINLIRSLHVGEEPPFSFLRRHSPKGLAEILPHLIESPHRWHRGRVFRGSPVSDPLQELQDRVGMLTTEVRGLKETLDAVKESLAEITERLRERPVVATATLYSLDDPKIRLKRPLNILLEDYDVEVVARFPELELHGVGPTEPDAIANLRREFISLYDDLIGSKPETLGKLPKRWVSLLQELVETHG